MSWLYTGVLQKIVNFLGFRSGKYHHPSDNPLFIIILKGEKMEDPKKRLREIRKEIDKIDEELLNLIARRIEYGKEIAHLKRMLGYPVEDGKREREIKDRIFKLCKKYNLDFQVVWSIIKTLIEYNKKVQREELKK